MGSPLNILIVSPFLPYPPKSGGHTRVFNVLKHLARRHAVDLICPVTRTDSEYIPHLASCCRNVVPVNIDGILENRWNIVRGNTLGRALSRIGRVALAVPPEISAFYYPPMRRQLTAMLEARQYDVVQVEYPRMAQHFKPRFYRDYSAIKILVEHDLSFVPHQRRYNNEKSPLRKAIRYLNYRMHRSFAIRTWKRFDRLVVMSEVDQRKMTDTAGGLSVDVVPNGVDLESFQPLGREGTERKLLFIGGGGHFPNVDALRYFVRDILPGVKALIGEFSLRVIGEGWDDMAAGLADDASVTFTGFVEDIRPHASGPSILVAPIRIGGGTRLKILEAMALGIPVVSTSIGAEGIPVETGRHVLLADSSDAFAASIKEIFSNADLCNRLIGNARDLVTRSFGWDKVAQEMEKVFSRIPRKTRPIPSASAL